MCSGLQDFFCSQTLSLSGRPPQSLRPKPSLTHSPAAAGHECLCACASCLCLSVCLWNFNLIFVVQHKTASVCLLSDNCNSGLLHFSRLCLLRQLLAVRLVRIAFECHFGVRLVNRHCHRAGHGRLVTSGNRRLVVGPVWGSAGSFTGPLPACTLSCISPSV